MEALGFELEYGYLAELEQAFRRGEIKDYPLFAGKEFNGGVTPWRGDALAPIHADVLKRWNKRLEQALGLTSVDGLGFRGWRRRLADVYERWATSARVKDMIMGHKQVKVNFNGGSTREVVYLDIRDEALTTEAMRLLQHARTQWALTGEAPPASACTHAALRAARPKSATKQNGGRPSWPPPVRMFRTVDQCAQWYPTSPVTSPIDFLLGDVVSLSQSILTTYPSRDGGI